MKSDPDRRFRRLRWIYVIAILGVSLPYLVSFGSQLISDDFILLYYYGRKPLWDLGAFFSPRTIWTYHPLQQYYYAVGWHLSGIEPWSYRAMSIALHLATTFILMKFVRDLTDSVHVGGWTALVFAAQWRHYLAVTWAGSIASVQSTFFTVLVCAAFLRHLQRRRRISYALTILAAMGWFFAKETFVQLPFFLAIIYLYHFWRERHDPPARRWVPRRPPQEPRPLWAAVCGEMFLYLAAPVVLVVVYLIFRFHMVENTYRFAGLAYEEFKVPLRAWGGNILSHLDFAINPLLGSQFLTYLPWSVAKGIFWSGQAHVLSIAILLLVWFFVVQRRMLPLFALAMTFLGMIPYFALKEGYTESRYHYASDLGAALLIVSLARELWLIASFDPEDRGPATTLGRALQGFFGRWSGWSSVIRVTVATCGALWLLTNLPSLAYYAVDDRRVNRPARELHDFFAAQADEIRGPVLFVVDPRPMKGSGGNTQPRPASDSLDVDLLGWGLLESARLALRTDEVSAVLLGFDVDPGPLADFNAIALKYWVRKGEKGWESDRLPDDYILRPGRRGGVELAQRP